MWSSSSQENAPARKSNRFAASGERSHLYSAILIDSTGCIIHRMMHNHLLPSGYNLPKTALKACTFSGPGLTADISSSDSKNSICARRSRSVGFAENLMSGLIDARRYACYGGEEAS